MAKRRKEKDEEEDKPFKLPKFDEEAFLKRERRNIKSTFISFLFGGLMALICFGFWALMDKHDLRWPLVLLVAAINATFLKYIFIRINLDLTDFGRKNWFGSYAIYLLSWLIIFMILVNPPFYDDEAPRIEVAVLPGMQEPGGDVVILAKITDNAGIEKQDITFSIDGEAVSPSAIHYIDNIFRYNYEGPNNITDDEDHDFTLTVKDHSGHSKVEKGSFIFSNDTIYLALPESGETVKAASDIKFGVKTDVWRVYYKVNDGEEINTTQQTDRTDFYITSPEYQGWAVGDNITVNVTAVIVYNFENHLLKDDEGNLLVDKNGNAIAYWFVNYINDTSTYRFDVADESTIGQKETEKALLPRARIVAAPGFEALVFLISLVVVVLIFKYRKKDRRNQK